MKSSVPGVGPVEVLEHEDDGPGRGQPLEERPPAREQLVRGDRRRLPTPSSARIAGSTQRRSVGVRHVPASIAATFARVVVSSSRLGEAAARRGSSRPAPRT